MGRHSRISSLDEFERDYVKPAPGPALIVGSKIYRDKPDRRKLHRDAIGVDMLEGEGVDFVVDLEEPLPIWLTGRNFAHIECMSVLEHSRRPWLLAANLERMLEPGGTIFVSVPFCWRIHAYPDDFYRFTPAGIRAIFPGIEWRDLMLAADELTRGRRLPATKVDGHPYMARTETVGFGRRAP